MIAPQTTDEKKQAEACFFLVQAERLTLQGNDVLSLWTFLALSYGELYSLAFSQGFEA